MWENAKVGGIVWAGGAHANRVLEPGLAFFEQSNAIGRKVR